MGHRSRAPWYGLGVVAVLVVAVIVAGALVFSSSHASLSADSSALAKVGLPSGGGRITSVTVVSGPHSQRIPVELRGQRIWPSATVGVHELVSIQVVVKRPGWISWLAGSSDRVRLTLTTPSASLSEHYLTLAPGAPLRLRFKSPVKAISYGPPGHLERHVLATPQSQVALQRASDAGSIAVAAVPRTWESSKPALVSWFPAGQATSVIASPAPGSSILPHTPILLTFSKPVDQALGSSTPPVSPAGSGSWRTVNSHAILFEPAGAGYGLGTTVRVPLPRDVGLVGDPKTGSSGGGSWKVPAGTTLRLQQLLAGLGYLPLRVDYAGPRPALTADAQETAAIHPPAGSFTWRYANTPAALRGMWQPGSAGVLTRGAVMAFENDHGITADGLAGATVWRALIAAALAGHGSTSGYSFVSVNVGSQSLSLWHSGHTVVTTPVNTGVAAAPTATGTYPVYEHIASGTMSGTNVDGSHYNDPGIQFISYFNGGDALHAFTRAQYGSPQSLGCVEMATGPAGQVFPYTPIGTLVNVG
ncbi:MAG: L,D-transpeptidase family protein [Solirubrobacteraceae bacterium]